MRDEDIISRILRGDCERYAEIIDRYGGKLYSTAYSYTHDQEDARDLVQEILIKAYNSLSSFKAEARFSTWLYRVAVNSCIDWTRRRRTRQNVIATIYDYEEGSAFDSLILEEDGPEGLLLRQEHQESIRNAIDHLPEIYKTVLILYYFEELQVQEISSILDCPRKTVETRLYRAKGLLKSLINDELLGGERYELQNL